MPPVPTEQELQEAIEQLEYDLRFIETPQERRTAEVQLFAMRQYLLLLQREPVWALHLYRYASEG